MSGDFGQFLEACGASGPLGLECDDCRTERPIRRDFRRPAVIVGRNPRADLVLDDPLVGRRHAYFQLVEGRLFAIDLGSRRGLRWGGVPRRMGWVDRCRPVQVGETSVRVCDADGIPGGAPGPGPTSRRFESRRDLPRAVLEVRGGGERKRTIPLERVLTLVGGSEQCAVRLSGPGISRFVCALLRTTVGVWSVDLLSSQGLVINGVRRTESLLEDGDVVRAGEVDFRVIYDGTHTPRRPAAPAGAAVSVGGLGPDRPGEDWLPSILRDRTNTLLSEPVLRPLLEGGELAADLASSPFGQALVLLIRLLGGMHRDHLQLVREELEQIRRIQAEIGAARTAPAPAVPGPPGAKIPAGTASNGDAEPDAAAPRQRPIDPGEIQSHLGWQLAAWEQERRGRWQRVIELLVKP